MSLLAELFSFTGKDEMSPLVEIDLVVLKCFYLSCLARMFPLIGRGEKFLLTEMSSSYSGGR